MIVVTGATGQLGRLVLDHLLGKVPADQVVAAVRDPAKAADLATRGVQVRQADYDQPDTLRSAFAGADKVLLISSSEVGKRLQQHKAAIAAAKEAGAGLLAYTGVLGGPNADFDLAAEHKATEAAILSASLPYVFLRNGWYNENYTAALPQVLASGAVVSNAGDGRVASAAREDYAEAAVAVLTSEGHTNTVYELSGDVAWGFAEYAAEITRQSGKAIAYRPISADEHRRILVDVGIPEPVADILVDVDNAIARGALAATTGELSRLIGHPTTPIADSIAAALKS